MAICLGAGVIGAYFTTPAIPDWYNGLVKPEFTPPNWVFAPVWNLLYCLMGIALFLVWNSKTTEERKAALKIFAGQLVLNVIWSAVFFGGRSPFDGLQVIVTLWLAIALTIARFKKVSSAATWLLVPYWVWVTYAAFLNYWIWRLN